MVPLRASSDAQQHDLGRRGVSEVGDAPRGLAIDGEGRRAKGEGTEQFAEGVVCTG